MTTQPTPELVALLELSAAEIKRLRDAMFSTYAAAQNGANQSRLLECIEAERDAYEAGYCIPQLRDAITRAAALPQGVSVDALDAERDRLNGDWHVCDGPSGYQHRILETGPAFDRTVCDVKESKDARLIAAAPAMFVALCRLSEYADMSNDSQYGTLSASMVKGLATDAIDAATTPPPAELGEGV